MPLDVFGLRQSVVEEYRSYVESFVNILDPRIDEFVQGELDRGELWPDEVLQLNPSFEAGKLSVWPRTPRALRAAHQTVEVN